MKKNILLNKLNEALSIEHDDTVDDILERSMSYYRFDNQQEFENYLSEGSLLNVSVLASKALSIPNGEYLVWVTDTGHTMLVPTAARNQGPKEVYEQNRDGYEVLTKDLMRNWNKLERTIAENTNTDNKNNDNKNSDNSDSKNNDGGFTTAIDKSTVDRTPIMRAMEDRGYTVTALAQAVGVDPPAISRILRVPKNVQGDPGGRNPSMGLASQICNILRIDPTAAFPDIFAADNYEPRNNPSNRGSGNNLHHPGSAGKQQHNESIELYHEICNSIIESRQPFNNFWNNAFLPTVETIDNESTLLEFMNTVKKVWDKTKAGANKAGQLAGEFVGQAKAGYNQGRQSVQQNQQQPQQTQQQPQQGAPTDDYKKGYNQGVTDSQAGTAKLMEDTISEIFGWNTKKSPRATIDRHNAAGFDAWSDNIDSSKFDRSVANMNAKIMPEIKKAFIEAMDLLKQKLQAVHTKTDANPKVSPHAWEIINRFYKTVVNAGDSYEPKWQIANKGKPPAYKSEYEKLRQEQAKSETTSDKPKSPSHPLPKPKLPSHPLPKPKLPSHPLPKPKTPHKPVEFEKRPDLPL